MYKKYLLAIGLSFLVSACGGGSGGDDKDGFDSFGSEFFKDPDNAPAAKVIVSGEWELTLTVLKDGCEDYDPGDSDSGPVTMVQDEDNEVTITNSDGEDLLESPVVGIVSGNKIYIEEKDSEEHLRAVLTINRDADPQTIKGETKWKYNDGEFSCEGGEKIEAECNSGSDCVALI